MLGLGRHPATDLLCRHPARGVIPAVPQPTSTLARAYTHTHAHMHTRTHVRAHMQSQQHIINWRCFRPLPTPCRPRHEALLVLNVEAYVAALEAKGDELSLTEVGGTGSRQRSGGGGQRQGCGVVCFSRPAGSRFPQAAANW